MEYEEIEEVIQEAFVRVLKGMDGFEGRSRVRTWAMGILFNEVRTASRRQSRERRHEKALRVTDLPGFWKGAEELEQDERDVEAIQLLSRRKFDALFAHFGEGKTYVEVAKELGDVTAAGAESLIKRATKEARLIRKGMPAVEGEVDE